MNTHLKAPEGPYSIVLPICKACIDRGCHIIGRFARQNDNVKQARLDADRAREELRQASVVSIPVVVDEGAQATKVAEEEHHDTRAPRRSRRITRTSSPRYCFFYFTHGVYIDTMHVHYCVIY